MSNKFYDIEPASDGSHYLMENGTPIARFTSLQTAELARREMTEELSRVQLAVRDGRVRFNPEFDREIRKQLGRTQEQGMER